MVKDGGEPYTIRASPSQTVGAVRAANSIPAGWAVAKGDGTLLYSGATLAASNLANGDTIHADPPADISLDLVKNGSTPVPITVKPDDTIGEVRRANGIPADWVMTSADGSPLSDDDTIAASVRCRPTRTARSLSALVLSSLWATIRVLCLAGAPTRRRHDQC